MQGLYVKNINCFFLLIEKNANTSLKIWSILNFCEDQDVVEKSREFLKKSEPQEFSKFFEKLVHVNNGHISENLKYASVSREELKKYIKRKTIFFGLLRDPVERSISIYGDKLDRLIPEAEQLVMGGKNSEMLRKAFVKKLGEYVSFTNLIKYLYYSDDHIRDYNVTSKKSLKNACIFDRHIRQQYELIGPIAELILSIKSENLISNHLFLLNIKDSKFIDEMLDSLTHFETKDKFKNIKMRESKQKYDFTKEEKEEIKKILASDYEFLENTNHYTYRKNE